MRFLESLECTNLAFKYEKESSIYPDNTLAVRIDLRVAEVFVHQIEKILRCSPTHAQALRRSRCFS
jgi:hypothetical protein